LNRYLCIHGHFYQPPRENPWLEEVELQDSAYPYHDWNERITIECYAPNTASRILDRQKKIINIVNNYEKISFNFGPTLLSWLEKHKPDTYKRIIEADKTSQAQFSGHGSAIAQVYNHMIMPLANQRDKRTQIIWGIQDFVYRFKRQPEGMWLAETAVDIETLEMLSEFGIKFTILSPYQAQKVRKIGEKDWIDVPGGSIDPKVPYQCNLPSGKVINIFFYDGPVSQDVAFGGLLDNGENFANRLLETFSGDSNQVQLVHIATDGETYGHHHSYGEMALSYGYYYIESNNLAKITIYGEYLEKFPPTHEVEIIKNSSWSCFHGVERWRKNCGCKIGTNRSWNQAWRKSLREAMDWLRDELIRLYEAQIYDHVRDSWQARDDYINVVLDRKSETIDAFVLRNAKKQLTGLDREKVLKLLEMQRHAMLMYTSCGWFFDDISNIETIQVMHYAGRSIQLVKQISGIDLEPGFLNILKNAKSNLVEFKNGAELYKKFVKPTMLDFYRIGAHYAISSLFTEYQKNAKLYCYEAENKSYQRQTAGKQQIALGTVKIKSNITLSEDTISFAILYLGDHILFGGLCAVMQDELFGKMQQQVKEAFQKSDIPGVISLFDRYFGKHDYTLWHLFRDEQRKVLNKILNSNLKEIEISFRKINENYYPIMLALREIGMPLPKVFSNTFEFIFNLDIRNILEAEPLDGKKLQQLVDEVKRWSLNIDKTTLGFVASQRINALMQAFNANPEDISPVKTIKNIFRILQPLSLQLRLWEAQNIYFSLGKMLYEGMQEKAKNTEDEISRRWVRNFKALGICLWVRS